MGWEAGVAKAKINQDETANDQVLPAGSVYIGRSVKPEFIYLRLANRHGLITGATGTGKTVTLQDLAEGFSNAGVPVFCADVKGDLSGIAMKGEPKKAFEKRAEEIGYKLDYEAFPAVFWDLFQEQGVPIRSTITELGPLLLSRLMDLSEAQEGVLNIAFRIADDEGLPLLSLADLRDLLANLGERGAEIKTSYGNVSKASIGAIQRSLLVLEQQGAENFFGEPALNVEDLMRTDGDGRGYVNILAADKLMQSPRLYGTFLLFLLSELFEELPEVGDPDKPKLVFFFDEAHLLFDDAPKALLDKVEQVVRLIRSKGVGVYFVTQNPLDVPDTVSSQLGNRVQHALRAYTPREQKAVKAAASTFRPNPDFDTEEAITQLGVGEALVSTLDEKGQPTMVERTLVRPPRSRVGPVTPKERADIIAGSPMMEKYEKTVDRRSASEILAERMEERPSTKEEAATNTKGRGAEEAKADPDAKKDEEPGVIVGWAYWLFGLDRKGKRLTGWQKSVRGFARETVVDAGEAVGRSVGGTSGAALGRSVARGLMGNLLR